MRSYFSSLRSIQTSPVSISSGLPRRVLGQFVHSSLGVKFLSRGLLVMLLRRGAASSCTKPTDQALASNEQLLYEAAQLWMKVVKKLTHGAQRKARQTQRQRNMSAYDWFSKRVRSIERVFTGYCVRSSSNDDLVTAVNLLFLTYPFLPEIGTRKTAFISLFLCKLFLRRLSQVQVISFKFPVKIFLK